jgi:excisionase family DNA binding protein
VVIVKHATFATDLPQPAIRQPVRLVEHTWLTYREAADYCGWTVAYLRNLVSAGKVPVYGKPRVRRFRRDMLDLFLTNPDAAMRKFRAERNSHGS